MNPSETSESTSFATGWFFSPWTAVLLAALLYTGVNFYWWDRAWDDMAITLGFARTFAVTGTIAPTPFSDPVEGTSSLLWMLVNASFYSIHGSPEILYAQAKLLGIAFLLFDVALVFMVATTCGVSQPIALIVSATFAGCLPAVVEAVNGMENPLYIFLYCAAFISFFGKGNKNSPGIFLISTSLILLTRWESILFLSPFVIVTWWRYGYRGLFAVQHWIWLALFAGLTAWRYATFGDLIPNTVRAKLNPPYLPPFSDGLGALIGRKIAQIEQALAQADLFVLLVAGIFVIVLAMLILHGRKTLASPREIVRATPWPVRLAVLIVVTVGIFATATWGAGGYRGRLFFIALPFLLVAAAWGLERLAVAKRLPVVAIGLIAFAAGAATVAHGVRGAFAYLDQNKLTVTRMAQILPALEEAKRLTGQSSLTVAHPDLGGPLLYGEGLRVVDTALLCNGPLARQGYDAFPAEIFTKERPDVIQTHGTWTEISHIAEAEALYTDYEPVFLKGVRLFMRRDVLAKIPAEMRERRPFSPDGLAPDYDPSLAWTRMSWAADRAINRRFGHYWVPVGNGRR